MFRPLQLTTLETLAGQMVLRDAPAGSDVIRQGEQGDTFYIVVVSGRLETLVDGRPIGEIGVGESFGEIALIRKATERTATVRAVQDSQLVELGEGAVPGSLSPAAGKAPLRRTRSSGRGWLRRSSRA